MGSRIRRLRRDRALSQVAMARQLGISASYLNLIEHNQRPLTMPLLLKLADCFQLDLQSFSSDGDARTLAALTEMMGDALFSGLETDAAELRDMVDTAPALCQALLTLYQAYRTARDDLHTLAEQLSDQAFLSTSAHELRTLLTNIRAFSEILQDHEELDVAQRRRFTGILADESERLGAVVAQMLRFAREEGADQQEPVMAPTEAVLDFIQAQDNHFPDLEEAAEALRREAALPANPDIAALGALLSERYGQRIEPCAGLPPLESMNAITDAGRPILLGEAEPASRGRFRLARRLAQLACGDLFARYLDDELLATPAAAALGHRALASYTAGALLLPYDEFLAAAETLRHDIARLQRRFAASFEQVCHRLTSLQRLDARGVPFHFLRVDIAGNLSKRFSASGLAVARFGGICPRWNVHAAFLTPGQLRTQISRFPDGSTYFDLACALEKPSGGHGEPRSFVAINIGCDLSLADRLVYSDGLDLGSEAAITPVGTTCRLCARLDCRQRAQDPILPSLTAG